MMTQRTSETRGSISSQTESQDTRKLEDRISLAHLFELKNIFLDAETKGDGKLNLESFKTEFNKVLRCRKKNTRELVAMFMKIDNKCSGTINWHDFCTYMLLEYQERDMMAEERMPPFPFRLRQLASPHRDVIACITALPNIHRGVVGCNRRNGQDGNPVTVSKDGMVCFWKSNFTIQRTVQIESASHKGLWVTDAVVMANIHKMMLSYSENVIDVHDLSTPNFERLFRLKGLPHCVVALNFWYNEKNYEHSILTFGDSGGGVAILEFSKISYCMFGMAPSTSKECKIVQFQQLLQCNVDGMKCRYIPQLHCDWVTRVKYWSCMEGVLSSSTDTNRSLVLSDLNGVKDGFVFKVRKGITSFDFCRDWNIIATGGLDRELRIWNPYVSTKPIVVLKGHNAAIQHVSINQKDGHILSFSKDLELRVWSIPDQICLQTCLSFQDMPSLVPYAFYYNTSTETLLVANSKIGALELYRDDPNKKPDISHDRPLCGALYSSQFNQVVTACHGSMIRVWDIDTGEKVIQFSKCHGNVEITAMSFDPTGRRLITGARDGSIKMWNFNNGAILAILENHYDDEVTTFCFIDNKILVSGWSRLLAEYTDSYELDVLRPRYWGHGVHTDDILCMDYKDPDILVTASYNGDIVVWDMEKKEAVAILTEASNEYNALSYRLFNKLISQQQYSARRRRSSAASGERGVELCQLSSRSRRRSSNISDKFVMPKTPEERQCSVTDSVEKVIFLQKRELNFSTATLISCGASGLVQFWNIYGGGLRGEFNVFDYGSELVRAIKCEDLRLHSVTSCTVDSHERTLITGNTLGYIQVWDITKYCMGLLSGRGSQGSGPPLKHSWRGHVSSVVSIVIAEEKEVIVTASTDRCVSVWTMAGRYIGTFGDKQTWTLTTPILPDILPNKLPQALHDDISQQTLKTVTGLVPIVKKKVTSAGKKRQLSWYEGHNSAPSSNSMSTLSQDHSLGSIPAKSGGSGGSGTTHSLKDLLFDKSYKRTTRFRQPIKPVKLCVSEFYSLNVYCFLKYFELEESKPAPLRLPTTDCPQTAELDSPCQYSTGSTEIQGPKKYFTESTLLPEITLQSEINN